jgi:hypothetical protein
LPSQAAEGTIRSFQPRARMTTTAEDQGNSFLKKMRIKYVNQEEIVRLRYVLEISRI